MQSLLQTHLLGAWYLGMEPSSLLAHSDSKEHKIGVWKGCYPAKPPQNSTQGVCVSSFKPARNKTAFSISTLKAFPSADIVNEFSCTGLSFFS